MKVYAELKQEELRLMVRQLREPASSLHREIRDVRLRLAQLAGV